jgi:hypothetical protein
VVRGGAFNNNENNVRCARRNRNNPNNRNNNNGFRLLLAHTFFAPAGNATDRPAQGGCVAEAIKKDGAACRSPGAKGGRSHRGNPARDAWPVSVG